MVVVFVVWVELDWIWLNLFIGFCLGGLDCMDRYEIREVICANAGK